MVAEVEYKLQKERTESKEDQLKDEVRRLQKEIDALGNHQNQIKSESTDLVTENKALSIQVEKYQKKASTNEFLFKQSGMERDKLLSKLAGADKEISTLHEKVKEKDNKIIELTKKIVESEASHMQTIEKKEGEYLQALKKSQLELQIAHYQIKKMQDEAESAMVRTKNETLLVPQFDNAQQKPASGTMMVDMSMSNLMALPIFTISEVENTAETQDKTIDQIDSSIENNDLVLEERSRKGSFALQMVGSNGPLRKDTGDSRFNGSSAAQSRRDSLQSNRFVRKGLVFGAKTSDAKLQAEVNELRIKLKEAHQECSNKVNQLLVVIHLI